MIDEVFLLLIDKICSPTSTSTQSAETFTATTVTVSSSSSAAPTTLSPSTTSEVTRSTLASTSEMSTTLVASTSSPVTTSSSETTSSPASTGTTQTTITPVTTATSALTSIPSQTTTSSSSTTTSTPVPNIEFRKEEISNKRDFRSKVTKCSHIARERELCFIKYTHHMLVHENTVDVFEYNFPKNVDLAISLITKQFGKIKKNTINIDDFFPENDSNLKVFIVNCHEYQEMTDEQKDDAIKRARSRLGEQQYCLTCNNCEHFVTWALLGKPICEQCKNAGVGCRFALDCFNALLSDIQGLIHLFQGFIPHIDILIRIVKILSVLKDCNDEENNGSWESMKDVLIEISYSPFLSDYQLLDMLDMLKIRKLGKENFITKEDMWREIVKRLLSVIFEVVISYIPLPFLKSIARNIFSRLLVRCVLSGVVGFLFDNVFKPMYQYLPARTQEWLSTIQTLLLRF